ncbi:hypothetical protein F5887DRAFT_1077906 [Amanita rubescens]|nr:hypothetical protein F5887DRAFT_1077906 [Amanita rubescens]
MPEPIPEPEPVVVADNAGDVTGVSGTGLLDVANTEVVSGGADNLDVGAQDAWNLGDNPDASWNLGGDNSAAVVDNSLVDVPGSFTGGGGEEGLSLLDNPVPPPDSNTGAPALFSGSISSFMTSSAVSGLGSKLGSFGLALVREVQELRIHHLEQDSLAPARNKTTLILNRVLDGDLQQGQLRRRLHPPWERVDLEIRNKTTLNLNRVQDGDPQQGQLRRRLDPPWEQVDLDGGSGKASPWGKAPSAAGSKTVSPNPPATPHVPEQAVEGRGGGSGKASPWGKASRSAAGSKAVSPNPPATPHVPDRRLKRSEDR